MWKPILLSCALILPVAAAPGAKREVFYAGDITPASIAPTFDNGYLAVYDLDRAAPVYAPDGSLAFRFLPPHGSVHNVAVDVDGAAAFALANLGPNDRGGISIANPEGVQIQWIDTGDYVPSGLSFAPDHSLWTIGWKRELSSGPELPQYEILRHYSRDGRELGRYLPRSSFAVEFPVGGPHPPTIGWTGGWGLRIAGGRIGACLLVGRKGLWVETDMSGKELGRWPLDPDGSPNAITADGTVYASTPRGILALDRSSGQWKPTAVQVPNGILLGAQGAQLVFAIRGEKRLLWLPAKP